MVLSQARKIEMEELQAMYFRKQKQFDEAIEICQSIDTKLDSVEIDDVQRSEFL